MISLMVCRTCPRYEGSPGSGGVTRGKRLADQVRAAAAGRGDLTVRVVNCLAGCKAPCNASISAPGKLRLRFSGLAVEGADDLLAVVATYDASADGDLDDADLPQRLRGHVTARSPVRIGD